MLRRPLTKLALGLAVSLGIVALGNGTAEAHLFHHGSWGGSWGSCGSSGGSWGSCGSSGGSWGSYGSYGSSGGSWGSYGSYGSCGSCGGYAYYGSCGSSGGSYGGSYGGEIYTTPAAPMAPGALTPPPTPVPPAVGTGRSTYDYRGADAAYLVVSVPAEAKVFVNDRPTTSTGAERQYVSHGLEQGMHYEYTVRAEMVRDGKTVSETKTVQLTAGNNSSLAFSFNNTAPEHTASAPSSVKTSVMLHVPADAKVYLAGQEMKSSGTEREFSTSKLALGGQWDNYQIRVVSQGDSQEKTINLKAGESRDVSFDFPAHVASTH